VSINNYKIVGSGIKQKGYNQSSVPNINYITSDNNTTSQIIGLYPSTQYTISISAKNSENINYGLESQSITFLTDDLTLNTNSIGQMSSNVLLYQVKQVNNLNDSSVQVILGNTTFSTNNIYIPIHLQGDIASTADSIRNIHSKVIINNQIINGPDIVFGGFGTQSPNDVGPTNGIKLNYISINDVYDLIPGSSGYFQYANISAEISGISLLSSPNKYSLILTDNSSLSSNYDYYYDTQMGNVYASNFSITGITGNTTNVSGIKIINGQINVSTLLNGVVNIGRYYCNNNDIVIYETTTGNLNEYENDFSNAGNWYLTDSNNDKYVNPSGITFTRNNLLLTPPTNTYLKYIELTSTIYGIGSSNSYKTPSSNYNVIIDNASINFVYNIFKQSLTNLSTNFISGYRIYSAQSISGDIPGYFSNGTSIMSSVGYNNNISIYNGTDTYGNNYNTELMVANGALITRGYDTTNLYFIDYSTYYSNSYNYSLIQSDNSKRFATFAWLLQNPVGSINYTNLYVNITFDYGTVFTQYDGGYKVNGSNFILYYRVEDNRNPEPTGTVSGPGDNQSSTWINGNSTSGTQVSTGNFNNVNLMPKYGLVNPPTISNNIITFQLKIPNNLASNTPQTTFYLRIGAQNNSNFKIINIEAKLAI